MTQKPTSLPILFLLALGENLLEAISFLSCSNLSAGVLIGSILGLPVHLTVDPGITLKPKLRLMPILYNSQLCWSASRGPR